jgi:hypothetical protein
LLDGGQEEILAARKNMKKGAKKVVSDVMSGWKPNPTFIDDEWVEVIHSVPIDHDPIETAIHLYPQQYKISTVQRTFNRVFF